MAQRGRPKKDTTEPKIRLRCNCCHKNKDADDFYNSSSVFYDEKVPMCKNCVEMCFSRYAKKYEHEGSNVYLRQALRRVCMVLDVYYSDHLADVALRNMETQTGLSVIGAYFKVAQLVQYRKKTYDDTISEDGSLIIPVIDILDKEDKDISISEKTIKFFGSGFPNEDYLYLQEQYDDWTARHECNTKAQEEIFKQICFAQLDLLKAQRAGEDTKDLTATFQKLLDTAKLQPKQNKGDTTAETQTFGTLIDKWENTRPIPQPDPELADVDNIGWYLDVFFKGHLAKMFNLKNGLSRLYDKFISQYTVTKPEYQSDEDNEALFDAIFGNTSEMSED